MYPEGFKLPVTCAILGFCPKLSFVALPPKKWHYGEVIHFEDFGHYFREGVWIIFAVQGERKDLCLLSISKERH